MAAIAGIGLGGDAGLKALCGGEKLSRELGVVLSGRVGELWNMYGPTETTVWSCIHRFTGQEEGSVIGGPIRNTGIYILDEGQGLVPLGVVGEICIGGRGLALGYWHRPELTAEKFVANPYGSGRLYRTGDMGRWQPDGRIAYMGRRDDQVKVRGYRIEPGEVESVLLGHGGVRSAAVVRGEDGRGSAYLAAYVVMQEGESVSGLKGYLRTRLPEYMVPSYVVELEAMPLTVNGKVDKRRLPEPEGSMLPQEVYVAPRNEVEKRLVKIWEEVLGVERIGINNNFFELGGNSLLAMRLIFCIRKTFGADVSIGDLFGNPTITGISGLLLSAPEVIDMLPPLRTGTRPGRIPLSYGQERLSFIDRFEGSLQYHLPLVLRMKGALDVAGLSYALKGVIRRHEVLRTVLKEEEGMVYQHILDAAGWELSQRDGRAWTAEELASHIRIVVNAPFDLSADHLLRLELIRTGEEEWVSVAVMHHIASDGWSFPILVREFNELYRSWKEGREASLPALEVQYADYAIWQRSYLSGGAGERQLSYWKEQLKDIPVLELPADYPRPAVQSIRGSRRGVWLERSVVDELRSLSQREGVTMYMTLLSVFKVLLYRYSGQKDIPVGSPVANRRQKEVEALVGFFVNTLVMRSDLGGDPTFRELLGRVKGTVLSAYAHQDLPFERVVDEVIKDRDRSHSPLCQVTFTMLNTGDVPDLSIEGLSWSSENYTADTSMFDISCYVDETSTGIQLEIQYCTDLFREETIDRLIGHYKELLRSVVADAGVRIGELGMLTVREQKQLLAEFNDTAAEDPQNITIIELFEEWVKRDGSLTALDLGGRSISYKEMNASANRLAHHLRRNLGVCRGDLVGMMAGLTDRTIIGIMGIWKCGAVYVPIDADYPPERKRYILEDSAAKVLLTESAYAVDIGWFDGKVFRLDLEWASLEDPADRPDLSIHQEDGAYVIYTSGTTGLPKGVLIGHGSLLNMALWELSAFGLSSEDRVLQFASLSFDASVWELSMAVGAGARLVLPDRFLLKDEHYFKGLLRDRGVTVALLPPAYADVLDLATLEPLRILVTGGERANAERSVEYSRWMRFYNAYGPTESTVIATMYKVGAKDKGCISIPIGRPIRNTGIFILDESQGLVPVKVVGEIYIGGRGLALGYLHRPELTAEKFVANPYGDGRLYRTGDMGRWLEDGNIEYIGRRDEQVKVRGYRIELGEIGTVLGGYPGIRQAVVVVREDKQGQRRLTGYVVTEEGMDREGMEQYLTGKLPEYMVPRQWVELAELPLTGNGKVDHKALPEPEAETADYVAPRSEMEETLAGIWQEVLGIDRIGIHDNFFELGGHSLLIIRVISAVRKALSVEMVIGDLFDCPTIAELGQKLSGEAAAFGLPVLEAGNRPERIPLSYGQERLWFIDRLEGSVQYHLPLVLRLKGVLDEAGLSYALKGVMSRHEVLRTVLREEEGMVYQHMLGAEGWELSKRDGMGWGPEELASHIRASVNSRFDLSADHLLRAELIGLKEDEHILVVVVHHIVSDGWSIPILVREFNELYRSWKEGREALLPVLEVQYADYAIWQRSYLSGGAGERQLSYWKERLKDTTVLELPVDYARPAVQSIRGSKRRVWLDGSVAEDLRSLSQREGVTMYMTLLAAFKVLLYRYSGQKDIPVGSPVTNRRQKEVEGLVGFFVNTLVMRSDLGGDPTFRELLGRVKGTVVSAYAHQDLPFERVVDEVVKHRDRSRSPLFQVMFAQLNTDNVPGLSMEGLIWSSEDYAVDMSKFDLTCYIEESSAGVRVEIEYCTDLFREETIDRLIGHYRELLRSVVADAGIGIGELGMLAAGERRQLLEAFNDTVVEYAKDQTVLDLIEEQVLGRREAVAVVYEGQELTYGELDRRSNQLGHYLRGLGVRAETLVPICVERGFEMLVGILGIMKAGGAYVPIDPAYPDERIYFMLEDIGAPWVVTDWAGRAALAAIADRELIDLDDWSRIGKEGTGAVARSAGPEHLAYMIYTSGSTGRPKGVLVEHGSLVNRLRWAQGYYGLGAEDVVLQKTTYCFDVSIGELLWPLMIGSVVVFARPGGHKDSRYMKELIGERGITMVHFVPSMLEVFLQEVVAGDCGSLRRVLCSGEALRADQVRLFRERLGERVELYNLYGPTEAAIEVTYWRAPEGEVREVPIGRPVWNTRLYIVDERGGLCPVGVPGELWIGGVQVGRGYWKRPELTAEKFVANPYGDGRLYRTGDMGRWLEDGNIEYIGRRDEQVKVRGYRIELGEIGTVLGGYPGIRQAVVVVREDKQGQRRLTGYVVTEEGMDREGMEQYLTGKLPEYMVPRQWVELAELPLTGNGKVDHKALPEPEAETADYVAPRSEMEETLAGIWQEVLGIERIGIHDDFFELGGHSLLIIRVLSLVRKVFSVEMAIGDLFEHPTIAELGQKLSGEAAAFGLPVLEAGNRPERIPLSYGQERLWFIDRLEGSVQYHLPLVLRLKGVLDEAGFSYALKGVMSRHEVLRTGLREEEGNGLPAYAGCGGMGAVEAGWDGLGTGGAGFAYPGVGEQPVRSVGRSFAAGGADRVKGGRAYFGGGGASYRIGRVVYSDPCEGVQ